MSATYSDRINGVETALGIKAPVVVATTEDITLFGLQTIDGIVLEDGDRVLVKEQSDPVQNGVYVASSGIWPRSKDFNGARDIAGGTLIFVRLGASGGSFFVVSTDAPVIGFSSIEFEVAAFSFAGKIYASRTAAEEAGVPASAIIIWVVHDSVLCLFSRSDTNIALTTGDGSTWGPAEGFDTYLQHYGLTTRDTETAVEAAGAAMTEAQRTAHQTTLEYALLNARGRLVIDGFIEAFDNVVIGGDYELDLKGGISDGDLEGGIYVSSRFNMGATEVVTGGAGTSAMNGEALHVIYNMSAAEASGDEADIIRYPAAFKPVGDFGRLQNFRVTRGWRAQIPGTNNGGWQFGRRQFSTLWDGIEDGGGALHFVEGGKIDDWVWGMGANLQALRTRTDSIEGRARVGYKLTRADNFTADAIGGFRMGPIVIDKGSDAAIADQIDNVRLDGDYTALDQISGRTQIGKLYGTKTIGSPNLPFQVRCQSGYMSIADGSLVGDDENTIDVQGGTFKYTGIIRNTSVNGRLVRAAGGVTILEGCTFIIQTNTGWNVGPIEQFAGATLIIRDCKAFTAAGAPVNLWRLIKFNARSPACEMDAPPASRADMVTALAGSTQFKFEPKGNETYLLDGLAYLGSADATGIPDMQKLKPVGEPTLVHYGGATQAAVDAMIADRGFVNVGGPMPVAENLIIAAPIHFAPGVYLTIATGVVVTLNGVIDSPRQHIFRGEGSVALGTPPLGGDVRCPVEASWWGVRVGAYADVGDQAPAIQRMFGAIGGTSEAIVKFDGGPTHMASGTTVPRGVRVDCTGIRRGLFKIIGDGFIPFTGVGEAVEFIEPQFETDVQLTEERAWPYIRLEGPKSKLIRPVGGRAFRSFEIVSTDCDVIDPMGFYNVAGSAGSSLVAVKGQRNHVYRAKSGSSSFGPTTLVHIGAAISGGSVTTTSDTEVEIARTSGPATPCITDHSDHTVTTTTITGSYAVRVGDDTAVSVVPPKAGGIALISVETASGFPSSSSTVIIGYDVGSSLANAKIGGGGNAFVVATDVTGTTGVDGNSTYGVVTGAIRIENRTGAICDYTLTWLS